MKGFQRTDPLFSLCGLNCGLCSMHLGGHCGGCGCGSQTCQIARCGMEHGSPAYCFLCEAYPCAKYEGIDAYDSFITHQNQRSDMAKAKSIGMAAYDAEQVEKGRLLNTLLSRYNAGREKTLYCLAVNLLEADDIKGILADVEADPRFHALTRKEQAARMVGALRALAEKKNIALKLRRK